MFPLVGGSGPMSAAPGEAVREFQGHGRRPRATQHTYSHGA